MITTYSRESKRDYTEETERSHRLASLKGRILGISYYGPYYRGVKSDIRIPILSSKFKCSMYR